MTLEWLPPTLAWQLAVVKYATEDWLKFVQ